MDKAKFMNSKTLTTKRLGSSTYMSMLQEYLHSQGNATFIYTLMSTFYDRNLPCPTKRRE